MKPTTHGVLAVFLARFGVRVLACFKASRLEPFVVPGLAPIVARWLPPPSP